MEIGGDVDVSSLTALAGVEPATHVVLGIDPGDTSAIAVCNVRPRVQLCRWELVSLKRAGFEQAHAIDLLQRLLGRALWMAAVERPPPPKEGIREAPSHAERYWRDVLDLLARRRCAAAGVRYSKPTILRPRPSDWRKPLGIRVRGIGTTPQECREDLKRAASQRLLQVHRVTVIQPDLAEAINISEWCARIAQRGVAPPARGRAVKELRWAA